MDQALPIDPSQPLSSPPPADDADAGSPTGGVSAAAAERARIAREGRALIETTKRFAAEDRAKRWLHLATVIGCLTAGTTVATVAPR